jgi:excisionase family DNA binding protein
MTGPFLTPKQAGEYLGLSTKTIYDWISKERLPAYRTGKKHSPVRLRREDLDAMLVK